MAAASENFDNKDRYEYTTDNASRVQGHELQRLNDEWKMKSSSNKNARAATLDGGGVRYNNNNNNDNNSKVYSNAYHEKRTVNGMDDYYTDNLDRVGGFIANDDSGKGIRKVNSLPASINGAGSGSGSEYGGGVRYNNNNNNDNNSKVYSNAYHEKRTVNGMDDYYTDNLDRVGGFIANDDSGKGIRKVNSLPASINGAGSGSGSKSGSSLVPYGDNIRHRNDDSKGSSRKGTVNGMSDYYTNLTDRMGSAHLENNNNWNVSMKNTNKARPGERAEMRAPSSSRRSAGKNRGSSRGRGGTVNGMSDYETDNIDRIGGFLGTNSGDGW
eukprot:CAMPEP_0194124784 /NCGR_PEP_ID=MMETSP0150-20130528/59125_1 /TAXON_ID=122233 /ORGANISM="Chaetoceros debilis, Strain MM31A-1" /LENGTH=326 /DNA_ID=CAMNT_0038818567 /DNA_START=214 /DNA_END=1194 /DNA_ORIENTATION=+